MHGIAVRRVRHMDVPNETAKRAWTQTVVSAMWQYLHDFQPLTCEKERTGDFSGLASFAAEATTAVRWC